MADPITLLGTAAAAVQLADVALRASREAYGFLTAVKDARKDVQDLRESLRDVDSNVRSLRNYIDAFSKSINATEDFEVLSETITRSLVNFRNDIDYLKTILPPDASPSLAQKFKWVYSKQKVKAVTERLLNRKADLNVALSITGRLHDLRHRQDTKNLGTTLTTLKTEAETIIRQQQLSHTAVLGQASVLNDHVKSQQENHTQLLQQIQQTSDSIGAVETRMHGQQEFSRTTICERISTFADQFRTHQDDHTYLIQEVQHTKNAVGTIQAQLLHERKQSQLSLDAINTGLLDIRSATSFSALNADMLAKTVRSELKSIVQPMLEQTFTNSEIRNEAKIRHMENMLDLISLELGQSATTENVFSEHWDPKPNNTGPRRNGEDPILAHRNQYFEGQGSSSLYNHGFQGQSTYSLATFKQSWSLRWKIGWMKIEVQRTSRRKDGSLENDSRFSICVHFRPSQTLLRLPGVSIFYSNAPNRRGFYQIAPMITIVPIASREHPIFDAILDGDIRLVQEMFASGIASPRCEDEDGNTLLHYAFAWFRLDLCKYLLSLGLALDHRDRYGDSPAHYAVARIFREFDISIQLNDTAPDSFPLTLRLIEEQGDDLSNVYESTLNDGLYHWEISADAPLEKIFTGIEYLLSKPAIDTWRVFYQFLGDSSLRPSREALDLTKISLSKGLDPNLRTPELEDPLLIRAIKGISKQKAKGLPTKIAEIEDSEPHSKEASELPPKSSEVPLWCIVATLIKAGADIYYMDSDSCESASAWYHIWTPWSYASKNDVISEWAAALQECGLDPDEVYRQDKQKCQQAIRLHGARRTGVDEEFLALPSAIGLRCRRHRRKYCGCGLE